MTKIYAKIEKTNIKTVYLQVFPKFAEISKTLYTKRFLCVIIANAH